jgi:hypothetical protein
LLTANLDRNPEKYDWCLTDDNEFVMFISDIYSSDSCCVAEQNKLYNSYIPKRDIKYNFGKSMDLDGKEVQRRYAEYFI